MHGYIDSSHASGRPMFKDDIREDEAVVNLAALVSSRYPTTILIIPASAASLNLGPEWDIKRCMVRAVFGSFGIPVISPDMLSTNIVWHSGSLLDGYMKLSDENVQNVITMLSSAQRLANALRKPDRMGYPVRHCDSPGHHQFLRQCDDGGWVPCYVTLERWQAFAALAGVDTRLFPRAGHSAAAYSFLAHDPDILLRSDLDLSTVQWRKRTDPIWDTEFDLPEIMLEAIDRELELLEYSKMIETDTTTVISVFKNVPPAADGTIYTEVALNTAKAL